MDRFMWRLNDSKEKLKIPHQRAQRKGKGKLKGKKSLETKG
jgi:hypothetical protein